MAQININAHTACICRFKIAHRNAEKVSNEKLTDDYSYNESHLLLPTHNIAKIIQPTGGVHNNTSVPIIFFILLSSKECF